MGSINKDTCKYIQINGGDLVEFNPDEPFVNPNPGNPFTVRFYLEEELLNLDNEWEFNDKVKSVNLSKMRTGKLKSMKRTLFGSSVESVTLPVIDADNVDIDGFIEESKIDSVEINGNETLKNKILAQYNKEIIPLKYSLTYEGEDLTVGDTIKVTLERVSTPELFEEAEITLVCEGCEVENDKLVDNAETFKSVFDAIVIANECSIKAYINDELIGEFTISDIKDKEVEEPEPEVPEEKTDLEKLIDDLEEGGEVEVNNNIEITEPLNITKDTNLILNGNITSEKSGLVITGNVTISGEGSIVAGSGGDYTAVTISSGTTKIENGNFSVGADAKGLGNSCIYVTNGNLEISGGHFETEAEYNGRKWVINKYNKGTGTISISGGEFIGFNPAKPNTDDDATYVAEGYEAVNIGDNNWKVELSTQSKLTEGGDIEVNHDIITNTPLNVTKESTIDFNDNSIKYEEGVKYETSEDQCLSSIIVNAPEANVTIKNVNIESNKYGVEVNAGNVTLENANISTFDKDDEEDKDTKYGVGLYPVRAFGGTVTIESGNYLGATTAIHADGGKIFIKGGTFEAVTDSRYNKETKYNTTKDLFTINVQDNLINKETSKLTDFIEITGGTFINFDPANPTSEVKCQYNSFVPEGYKSVKREDVDIWDVVKE